MDLVGGLAIGMLLLAAGSGMIWKLHSLAAWFSAGLLLAVAGLVAIVGTLSGATIGATLGGAASAVVIILGLCLWPKGDFT